MSLSPFCGWGNWRTERLSKLPIVAELSDCHTSALRWLECSPLRALSSLTADTASSYLSLHPQCAMRSSQWMAGMEQRRDSTGEAGSRGAAKARVQTRSDSGEEVTFVCASYKKLTREEIISGAKWAKPFFKKKIHIFTISTLCSFV